MWYSIPMETRKERRSAPAGDIKIRRLRIINRVMLGIGILFLGYVGVMYVLFYLHTH
jgi:hypothetical protein